MKFPFLTFLTTATAATLLVGTFVTAFATAFATEYYVDSATGDDLSAGTSPETAWRSVERVNRAKLQPGDVVRFRRGRVWRATLRTKSGAPENPVVYSDFGPKTEPKPRILQSVDLSSPECWTRVSESPSIWATVPPEIADVPTDRIDARVPGADRFATGGWSVYVENGAAATGRTTEIDGKTAFVVDCEKSGEKPTYLQVSVQRFPIAAGKTIVWRFRARASKPIELSPGVVSLFMTPAPWSSYGNVVRAPQTIGTDWADYEIVFQTTTDADDARLAFFLGGALPDGATLELIPGEAREVEYRSFHLDEDVGNLVLTRKAADAADADSSNDSAPVASTPVAPKTLAELRDPQTAATKTFAPTWEDAREFAGFKRWALDELKEKYDFWYDYESERVYLLTDENPGLEFDSVEAPLRRNAAICNASDVVVENLFFSHTAAHGTSFGNAKRCVYRDCDFDWIGGGDLYRQGGSGKRVRYGNGVEFWESSEDCLVERCRFSRVYDVAATTQGPGEGRSIDLTFRDNVMFRCEQSLEIWFTSPQTTVEGLVFERNLCVDSGRGWSHRQRPDKRATPLLAYMLDAKTVDVTIRDNVFVGTAAWFVWFYHSRIDEYKFENNVYWAADASLEPREAGDEFFWFDAKNPRSLTLDGFRAAGIEPNARWLEPKFADKAKDDYRLLNRDELNAGPRLD